MDDEKIKNAQNNLNKIGTGMSNAGCFLTGCITIPGIILILTFVMCGIK